jgi:hypothetical protein
MRYSRTDTNVTKEVIKKLRYISLLPLKLISTFILKSDPMSGILYNYNIIKLHKVIEQ